MLFLLNEDVHIYKHAPYMHAVTINVDCIICTGYICNKSICIPLHGIQKMCIYSDAKTTPTLLYDGFNIFSPSMHQVSRCRLLFTHCRVQNFIITL